MTVTSREISHTLSRYLASHPDEHENAAPLLSSLADGTDVTSRSTMPGHVTCGAAVINDTGKVLLIRHKALERWLLPGGHIDPGDPGLPAAALRELAEETGISWQQAVSPPGLDRIPLDIDVHHIPASPTKREPAHWHADFRFAFLVTDPGVLLQIEEVSDYAWLEPPTLQATRLAAKVTRLAAWLAPQHPKRPEGKSW
jgi:8-oxo-dGTP pyrophosphatase MutT (NUDIX family)